MTRVHGSENTMKRGPFSENKGREGGIESALARLQNNQALAKGNWRMENGELGLDCRLSLSGEKSEIVPPLHLYMLC